MKSLSISTKIFIGLVFLYSLAAALNLFLPQGNFVPTQEMGNLPAPKNVFALAIAGVVFVVYGGFGFLGLYLSKKNGFAELWDAKISNKQRFLIPAVTGFIIGVIFILGDLIFSKINGVGHIIHPPFPTSIVASFAAGIGEEIMFRLFFISFWFWILSLIFRKRWPNQIFLILAIMSALLFAVGHYPSMMIILGFKSITEIPLVFQIEIIILNSLVSIPAAYYLKKYGFLAAAGVHFWTDIVWHVIYGLFLV